ncbi:bifunctional [glutamate--ammonia ligase]-adenylyl-L-tyrosine phosphorylase/[glutamate--ammonia-ligase] adenylyltransferase [Conservatibacter flavescens]|nr:bifunctional [glutamate--ammonia ligase]-adenylyl-L-tyrosine phosphorylase/[glutamate--ammonia-ligase] adenylyltransferase [Conservatibacter flavescens]
MKQLPSNPNTFSALSEILIRHFPEQFDQNICQQLFSESNLATPMGKLTFAINMSDFFAETLQKQPHFFYEILQEPINLEKCGQFSERLQDLLAQTEDEASLYKVLRQFRNREMAKLSYCQSLNLGTVEDIFIRLSQLAEALIINTRDWLYNKLCQEVGTPTDQHGNPQPLLILGMGKLGGFELNFSSDIDLIFTYPENGETVGTRRSIDNAKFFTRLGQRLINALDEFTPDGFVYRTDMRLRPFGENGALALSFNGMETYYQEQGRDWERYAMIKGRILGADPNCPYQRYLRQLLRPFVYRRYIDFSVIQSLRDMKGKIEREVRRRGLVDNIKLGAGGIREIEFIVQVFQLIRGGREIALQQHSLLQLLPLLAELKLISPTESQNLMQAYLFLRRVENVLQAINDQQTQQLPENALDRCRLVQACANFTQWNTRQQATNVHYPIEDWASFYHVLQSHQQKVRSVFKHLIGDENDNETNDENEWQDFLDTDFNSTEFEHLLTENGVSPQDFEEIISKLVLFKQEASRKPMGVRGQDVLGQLLPKLLPQIFAYENHRTLLPRILTILEKILTRTTYLELLLENPAALAQLLQLCAQSQLIAEQVALHPILLDELLDPQALRNPPPHDQYHVELQQYLLRLPQDDEEQFIDGLRQFKNASLLRIAAADILGALPVMKVSDHLTFLAEAVLEAVVNLAWQQLTLRYGKPAHLTDMEKGFLVVGYGKLGGIELGYKSDLDLVFLYDNRQQSQTEGGRRHIESSQFYLKLAQKIVSIFSMNTSAGILYDIDMRLRPSGEAGLLVNSFKAFEDYQRHDAWTWETQSLVRSRAVYGSEDLRQQFETIRQQILATPRELHKLKQDVCAMRQKMYAHLANTDEALFNIKTDIGGITDIEFIAQYLVLANAPNNPSLSMWSDNVRIFEIMAENAVISVKDAEQLKHCYTRLRNEIHHLNLLGKSSVVSHTQFRNERAFVQQIWQQLLQ